MKLNRSKTFFHVLAFSCYLFFSGVTNTALSAEEYGYRTCSWVNFFSVGDTQGQCTTTIIDFGYFWSWTSVCHDQTIPPSGRYYSYAGAGNWLGNCGSTWVVYA